MDIRSGKAYPASALSNFAPHPFVFDGVEFSSMEGLLQSFKFENPDVQREVCRLLGRAAKQRGAKRNRAWQRKQMLWWRGTPYRRASREYQELLDRAFDALSTSPGFRRALLATGDAVLTHSIGKNKVRETCLTKRELVSRLTRIRARFREEAGRSR